MTVLDAKNRPHQFRVVGLVDFGIDQEASIFGAVGFDPATASRMTGQQTYQEIDIAGTVSKAAVKAATGPGTGVYTGRSSARSWRRPRAPTRRSSAPVC